MNAFISLNEWNIVLIQYLVINV